MRSRLRFSFWMFLNCCQVQIHIPVNLFIFPWETFFIRLSNYIIKCNNLSQLIIFASFIRWKHCFIAVIKFSPCELETWGAKKNQGKLNEQKIWKNTEKLGECKKAGDNENAIKNIKLEFMRNFFWLKTLWLNFLISFLFALYLAIKQSLDSNYPLIT